MWHVVQLVLNEHNTSYRVGVNWIESHDRQCDAERRAEQMNYFRSSQCVGVEYKAIGPLDETKDIDHANQIDAIISRLEK